MPKKIKAKRKKSSDLLILGIMVVILLLAVISSSRKSPAECKTITVQEPELPKISDLAEQDQSFKQCLDRTISDQYFCAAIIKNNADYCEGINTIFQKTLCKAHIERNPELCEGLPDSKDKCYQDYAINKGDKELCRKIKDPDKKNSCIGATTSNPKLCKDINEEDKFICIINLAEFTRNKKLCEMLENKEYCYEHLSWIK